MRLRLRILGLCCLVEVFPQLSSLGHEHFLAQHRPEPGDEPWVSIRITGLSSAAK